MLKDEVGSDSVRLWEESGFTLKARDYQNWLIIITWIAFKHGKFQAPLWKFLFIRPESGSNLFFKSSL